MSYLLRFLKKTAGLLGLEMPSTMTEGITAPKFVTGSVTAGSQTTASYYTTIAGGARIYQWATMTTAAVPIPNAKGDLGICTGTGKLYIASAASASTDWKLVTSAS